MALRLPSWGPAVHSGSGVRGLGFRVWGLGVMFPTHFALQYKPRSGPQSIYSGFQKPETQRPPSPKVEKPENWIITLPMPSAISAPIMLNPSCNLLRFTIEINAPKAQSTAQHAKAAGALHLRSRGGMVRKRKVRKAPALCRAFKLPLLKV